MKKSFEAELQKLDIWHKKEPGVQLLKVAYKDVIDNPKVEAEKIQDFLGRDLDIDKMVSQVEADLYRNRILKF